MTDFDLPVGAVKLSSRLVDTNSPKMSGNHQSAERMMTAICRVTKLGSIPGLSADKQLQIALGEKYQRYLRMKAASHRHG